MAIAEILFVLVLVLGLLLPSALAKQWWLFRVFLIFFICFGLVEWWAVSSTDMSVSQHFWAYSEIHPNGAWFVLFGMAVAWLGLLVHLGAKLINHNKKEK